MLFYKLAILFSSYKYHVQISYTIEWLERSLVIISSYHRTSFLNINGLLVYFKQIFIWWFSVILCLYLFISLAILMNSIACVCYFEDSLQVNFSSVSIKFVHIYICSVDMSSTLTLDLFILFFLKYGHQRKV